jgi:SAM-dependent methyltransferase
MIKEILQTENSGLGNMKSAECVGFDHYDATADIIFEDSNFKSYLPLAYAIWKNFGKVNTVLELGCGAGVLSHHYRKMNPDVEYVTLDINKDVPGNGVVNDDTHFICYTDRDFQIQKDSSDLKFDLILSFEHFEHIPPKNISSFLNNIKRHCHEDTIVIATAALWSGGDGRHPLVLNYSEWAGLLEENGFKTLPERHFLTREIIPYNFQLEWSVELIFKLK